MSIQFCNYPHTIYVQEKGLHQILGQILNEYQEKSPPNAPYGWRTLNYETFYKEKPVPKNVRNF